MTRGSMSGKKAAQIAKRDGGWKCHYCGGELITDGESYVRYQSDPQSEEYGRLAVIDHVTPKAKGGSDDLHNLVLACRSCNGKKGTKDRDEFITWIDFGQEAETSIRIRRAAHSAQNPYFLVRRATAQDEFLSWEALGLLTYVLSKPDDWSVRPSDLRQRCGRDKVYKILNELIDARYVKRVENLDEKGRHVSTYYEIFESPLPENPEADKPDTGLPDTENPDSTYKRKTYQRDSQNTESTKEFVFGGSDSLLVQVIANITGCDPLLNPAEIAGIVSSLQKSGYTAQDVRDWHKQVWLKNWRSRGGPPSVQEVRRFIGQLRAQQEAQPDGGDKYTDDAYFQDHDLDEQPTTAQQPVREAYTGRWNDQWLATLNDMQGKLNKSSYDTWLRHAQLIDVVERDDDIVEFKVEVHDHYVKDWIERHLMASLEANLCDICHFHSEHRRLKSGRIGAGVKIALEDGSL